MKLCCKTNKKDKQCKRKSDGIKFSLPRRFNKKRCRQGVKGFSMKSSCAPYKDCIINKIKGGNNTRKDRKKKITFRKNMLNKEIQECSTKPMTGYFRDGYCMTGSEDKGTHTVCATMNKTFLDYTKEKGNDLSSVVKSGEKWCLCEYRWEESFKDGKAPKVDMNGTNMRTKKDIREMIKTHSNRYKRKSFLYNSDDPKKSFDVYTDKDPSDTIPIKYTTVKDVKQTIKNLERLYEQGIYPHKRIWQVGMIMYVRLKVLKGKKKEHYTLAKRYFKHLGKRTKIKGETNRKKFKFKI